MIEKITNFLKDIDADAWIQTLGGFAGALLAGVIAIIIFKNQVKFDTSRERVKELENFLKSNIVIEAWLKSLPDSILSLDDAVTQRKRTTITNELEALKYAIGNLDKLKDDYIPMDVYKDFIEMKTVLDLIVTEAEIQLGTFQGHPLPGYTPDFQSLAKEVLKYSKRFAEYGEESKLELKKLKGLL